MISTFHYNQAREVVLDEAGVIGTTYMRADLLPEPYRKEIRNLLREYVIELQNTMGASND